MEILLDACAIMAVIADEPESELVINLTKGAILISPNIVSCEIANGLTKMMKKRVIGEKETMLNLYRNFKRIPIKTVEADLEKSPFEGIPRIKLDITTEEIVKMFKENRAGI